LRTAFWSAARPCNKAVNFEEEDDEDREDDEADGVVVWDEDTAVWLVWSAASFAWADATADWSELTVVARLVVFNTANVWPTATDDPTCTLTDAIWPAIGNATVAWLTGCSVPIAANDSVTDAGPAIAIR
jgi:hypothetical protein